ncbi:MAG: DUF1501 domain-containing protein, partial [Pirellulaceae bacterium]
MSDTHPPLDGHQQSRRQFLFRYANGFAGLALSALLRESALAEPADSSLTLPEPHRTPQAKSIIFLFMDGGPSQVDTFDPKPRLQKEDGQPIPLSVTSTFPNSGKVLASPFRFRQHGQSGASVSELFPETARMVDDMAIVRSVHHEFSNHSSACYFQHTGHNLPGRPSLGSWLTYGLGSESEELPGYVVIDCGIIPSGGTNNFGSGFLPASYQGTIFKGNLPQPISDVRPREEKPDLQRQKLDLIRQLDRYELDHFGSSTALDAAIANYELAFRMQTAVPDLTNLSAESVATQKLYGMDRPETETYGRACLLARRLVERGVRFIQVTPPDTGNNRWDQHTNLEKGHRQNAAATDRAVAGLLSDLKSRGLLDETLVVWGGEFGRTPSAETKGGRDHNPFGFTMWLAGGGIRGGTVYGATDDYGYFAVENKVHVHDLHATILHLMGLDHQR